MNRSTWLIVGATLLALGVGLFALGHLEKESAVRQVGHVVADPGAHTEGTYTLVGRPQPPTLAGIGSGGPVTTPNPDYRNETRHVVAWTADDGRLMHSTNTLRVEGPDAQGHTHWTHRNATRVAGGGGEPHVQETQWSLTAPHTLFLVQGFEMPDAAEEWVWAVYPGVLRDPLQPKPSQFTGRLATDLPGGTHLPAGALVYWVEEYTAGCSSKYLPTELHDEDGVY